MAAVKATISISRRKLIRGAAALAAMSATGISCTESHDGQESAKAKVVATIDPCDTMTNVETNSPFPAFAVWLALTTNAAWLTKCGQAQIEGDFGLKPHTLDAVWKKMHDTGNMTPITSTSALYDKIRQEFQSVVSSVQDAHGNPLYSGGQCPLSLMALVSLSKCKWAPQ
jgi:hypothetical protein